MSKSLIEQQMAARMNTVTEQRAFLEAIAAENRELTGEETAKNEAFDKDIEDRTLVITKLEADEARNRAIDEDFEKRGLNRGGEPDHEAEHRANLDFNKALREMRNGDSMMIEPQAGEKRAMATTTTGAPIPTDFYDKVVDLARATGPMLDPRWVTILNTAGGNPLQIPTQATFSTPNYGTEGTAKDTSEPTFNALKTLGGYVESFMMYVNEELFEDAVFDLNGFLQRQAGNAIGFKANTWLTTGTGTTQPTGIVSAAGSGITGGTGVSGAFTYSNVVDLIYSLDQAVRMSTSFAVMGGTQAMAALRKLTDPAGRYIWEPSLQAGQPATVLGYPIVENVGMAAPATSAKSLVAGDLSSYWVRLVGGIQLKRSDDYKFAEGQVAFRGRLRVDGVLTQSSHVKYFAGAAS